MNAELPLGDGSQTPDDFAKQQSASTGLPVALCRANMKKNQFVLSEMGNILKSLTRGLDLNVLTTGYGEENGVPISYQAQSPVLGLVLPSNSPGVHTLWLPIIPMQIGLVLKPGPQEPWTPYRVAEAFFQAGIPREAISIYPGEAEVGAAVVAACGRSLIFGGTATVERYKGNPHVQVHGPGFSKIVFGDDCVDDWERYVDMMADSVFLNSGRGCINCSGIWVSRNSREIADALARRLASIQALPPDDPNASLAAFTVPGMADAISQSIDVDLKASGVTDYTAKYRDTPRVVKNGRAEYLLPTVVHCESPEAAIASKEYMFPFVTVVECPESKLLEAMGPTLVCTAITREAGAAPRAARRDAHRSAESRTCPHHPAQLAPAARRQHRRFPVSAACVAERQHVKILFITAGAAGMYCGSCLQRQRARRRAEIARARRPARSALHADADRRAQRQRTARLLRRHQRLPAAARRILPLGAAHCRQAARRAVAHQGRFVGIDFHRSAIARRDDDFDAQGRGRLSAEGIRQDARVAGERARRRTWCSCRTRCWRASRRRCAASLKRPIHCTLQGEDLFLDGLTRTASRRRDRADSEECRVRRSVHGGERLLRRLHGEVSVDSAREDRRRAAWHQPRRIRSAARRAVRQPVHGRISREDRARERVVGSLRRLRPIQADARRRERAARSGRLSRAGSAEVSEGCGAPADQRRTWRRVSLSRRARSRAEDRISSEPRRVLGPDGVRRAEGFVSARGDGVRSAGRAAAPRRLPRDAGEGHQAGFSSSRAIRKASPKDSIELWKDPARRAELGRNGFDGVREHYSVSRSADRMLEVYERSTC